MTTRCIFCPEVGVATTATTTPNEAFPFLCKQLGLSTLFEGGGNGGGGGPSRPLCRGCHSLWEEVSVLYSNMQGLFNLMARRVTQFKKNIDKGNGDREGGPDPRKRKPQPPPPDDESLLSWWYPSGLDSKEKRKKSEDTQREDGAGADVENDQLGGVNDVEIKTELADDDEVREDQEEKDQEMEFEDIEIFPDDSDDDGGGDLSYDLSCDDPLQLPSLYPTTRSSKKGRQFELSTTKEKVAINELGKEKTEDEIPPKPHNKWTSGIPRRIWSDVEKQLILDYLLDTIQSGKAIEKPNAAIFYYKLIQTYPQFNDATIVQVKNVVKNLKKSYDIVISWRNQTGDGIEDKTYIRDWILKKCPLFDTLDEIYGKKATVPSQPRRTY